MEPSSEEEYVHATFTVSAMAYQKLPKFTVRINGTPIDIMADTGASVNILDEVAFAKLRTKPKLNKTNEKIFPYGSNKPLPLVGKCKCEVETEKKFSMEMFFIVKGTTGCLVSWKGSQRLGLVQVVQSVEQPKVVDKVESLVEHGISPDPAKVTTIKEFTTPKDASEISSLLGMTNFCCRFIKNFATLTQPIRELTKKGVPFAWTVKQERALEKLRDALTNASENAYFDSTEKTEVFTDASPVGVAAVLTQKDPDSDKRKIIAYASRALSSTEQNYSQLEREALAIVWSCEHFHLYLYRTKFTVFTDHQPLVSIFSNPASKPSACLERWSLRLQPYDVTICYQPWTENPADYLSRHPRRDVAPNTRQEKVAEEFINFLAETSTPKTIDLTDLKSATKNDATLQAVMKAVQIGKWYESSKDEKINTLDFMSFEKVKDELCTLPDLILTGHRIVIPETLGEKVIDIAHEGHVKMVKTKALIREKVWFPKIHRLVEEKVKSCLACQVTMPLNVKEPLQMSNLPKAPWTELCMDFGLAPTGPYRRLLKISTCRNSPVDVF